MGRVKTEILVVESEAIAYANYGHEAKQLYVMWKIYIFLKSKVLYPNIVRYVFLTPKYLLFST